MDKNSPLTTGYGSVRAWSIVVLLCLLYTTSFVDRMILALLADAVAGSLNVNDTKIGVLVGIGFAALYVVIGLPIAHIVDAGYRRIVLFLGVILWSAATIASGFVESYPTLFIARAGVAIGEAALTPVAISLIADMFSWKRRGFATSLYMGTGILMGSGAFVIGGAAIQLAETLTAHFSLESWRLTFVIVGIPGLVLAPLTTILIRRHAPGNISAPKDSSIKAVMEYLQSHARAYLSIFAGVGVISALSMGLIVWLPTVLVRAHGLSMAEAGVKFGLVGAPMAVLGTILGPYFAQLLLRAGRTDAIAIVLSGAAVIAALSIAITVTLPDRLLVLAGFALGMFALAAATVMPAIIIQLYTPTNMRARLMALNLLCLNLIGLGSGPVVVAQLASYLEVSNPLGQALQIVAVMVSAISLMLFLYARGPLAQLKPAT